MVSTLFKYKLKSNNLKIIEPDTTLPGIWKHTIGVPEKITPQSTRTVKPDKDGLNNLPSVETCPIQITGRVNERGVLVKLPLKPDECIYGLGLQLQSFQQRGSKKMLRVNADPKIDSGDSHAPVPFFVTTSGYGVLVDTARYATFYLGNKKLKQRVNVKESDKKEINNKWNKLNGLYEKLGIGKNSEILIEIPRAEGVDVYVFAGPSFLNAVQRYNLFSGGGVLPPRWGLGFWYRCQTDFTQDEVKGMADYFRKSKIPCDVIGLEPGWQSHSYSCSYVWSNRFPDPGKMIKELKDKHFRINLWEHAFVNSSSPIYKDLYPYSGNYTVWDGLVPDFITKTGKKIFADFHEKEHVELGVSGYKLDECDNSDFTGNWSFPELSSFPSESDGEQMHCLFGLRYQDTIKSIFDKKKERTYGLVRSSGASASTYPFVLYSDLYDHKVFIHAVAQSGFSGILWTPEVRNAASNEDLIRRLQTVVFSPLAMVNAWYLKNAPWKQIERKANNEGRFEEDWEKLEAKCREIIKLRMRLIPHIHTAFVKYHRQGIPPFRAMVMDYPDDVNVLNISSQFLVGENMLVAPVIEGENVRKVYLPEGEWYHLWTHKKYEGKQEYSIDVPIDYIPVFIKSGTILPLAKPTLYTGDPESLHLTVLVFGKQQEPYVLYEDDGNLNPALNEVKLKWDNEKQKGKVERNGNSTSGQYTVTRWEYIV